MFEREIEQFIFHFFKFWCVAIKTSSISSRNDFYKCLTLMALTQQGKSIDEKLLNNYVN
jgi:NADH:ubiquinone oxidoreductase subunit 6 (subunit J)